MTGIKALLLWIFLPDVKGRPIRDEDRETHRHHRRLWHRSRPGQFPVTKQITLLSLVFQQLGWWVSLCVMCEKVLQKSFCRRVTKVQLQIFLLRIEKQRLGNDEGGCWWLLTAKCWSPAYFNLVHRGFFSRLLRLKGTIRQLVTCWSCCLLSEFTISCINHWLEMPASHKSHSNFTHWLRSATSVSSCNHPYI